ncbi:translation initiation factor IF-3, mitochondrial [Ornithorhynchus anatinus]|uniref:translation initiation factor IF-3, mitochondrial n=1 Tax=Ornithorhynchus anatinus TaxID=9258 RepID=UPI0000EDF719|nr:translation initiation factor IF-3, mitochondrial [Ornithorhynchus anatinus]XP_028904231.1 translation initiation factor IF-3, mitochondrial [Ornithorhynchus anatinus]
MAALCLQKLLPRAPKATIVHGGSRVGACVLQRLAPGPLWPVAWTPGAKPLLARPFCSTDEAVVEEPRGRKTPSKPTFSNVGRKIQHRILQVLDEQGEDLGAMHRADVIRLMEERGLRLVLLRPATEPPLYQLLTGSQIHEERLRLREKSKAKSQTGPTQLKELTFSSSITQHDLHTKTKQIQEWIEKKHQVRITIKKGKFVKEEEHNLEGLFDEILQAVPILTTFSSKPRVIKDGRVATCVLRAMSKREITEYKKTQEEKQDGQGPSLEKSGNEPCGSDSLQQ